MGLFIPVNGRKGSATDVVPKCGRMDPTTKDIGPTTRPTARDVLSTLTVISTKESGTMIRPMDKEFISILMGLSIEDIG